MAVHTSDRYPFLLIEIQFVRSKLGNSVEIELSSGIIGSARYPSVACVCVYVCECAKSRTPSTFYTSSTVEQRERSFVDDISQHENVATLIPLPSNVGTHRRCLLVSNFRVSNHIYSLSTISRSRG